MSYYRKKCDVEEVRAGNGHSSFPMLGKEEGCTNGSCGGISYYSSTAYTPAAVHEDQEGFIVLSGSGWAKIGGEEFAVEPETAFIAPAGIEHRIRSSDASIPLVLFWFHAQP